MIYTYVPNQGPAGVLSLLTDFEAIEEVIMPIRIRFRDKGATSLRRIEAGVEWYTQIHTRCEEGE